MRALLSLPALALLLPTLWQPVARVPADPSSPTLRREAPEPDLEPDDELAFQRAGCVACHAAPEPSSERLTAWPAPPFNALGSATTTEALAARLDAHFVGKNGGAGERARALAMFLREANGRALEPADASAATVERGEHLFDELACAACHTEQLGGLAMSTDHPALSSFLSGPSGSRPDLDHDFGLDDAEADALAAHLLRETLVTGAPGPGFLVECFELPIRNGDEPVLEGREPSYRGAVRAIDVSPGSRGDNFALRFVTTLMVERAGTYRFEVGSDDGSWLRIDDRPVAANPGLHPYGQKRGSIELAEGPHELRLVYTQGGGERRLTLRWAPPDGDFAEIPLERTSTRVDQLTPPTDPALPLSGTRSEPDTQPLVALGSDLYRSLACAACHGGPARKPAKNARPLTALDPSGDCQIASIDAPTRRFLATLPDRERTAAEDLEFELGRARCLSCHERDGRGGLEESVARALTETQDLGEEGRRPPSLDRAGHRFQTDWIRAVLAERADTRPYMRARCIGLPAERADRIARAFAAVDSEEGDDVEPGFSADSLELGRQLIGVKGKVCIACHRVQGRESLGPQGMDLSAQSRRLKPRWFGEWLRRPHELRPGTRMPPFWLGADRVTAEREIDAVRVWTNFGAAAPLPEGVSFDTAGHIVEIGERTRLHAAFLDELSARCLLVGTPARVHYAYDLEHARLRWLWRGAFVDGRGTWNGRAGELVRPLGDDWVVLPGDNGAVAPLAAARDQRLRVVSRRIDAEGHPTFVLQLGETRIEDALRPAFEAKGPVLVRTLTVIAGSARFDLGESDAWSARTRGGDAVDPRQLLKAGEALEVIYRW